MQLQSLESPGAVEECRPAASPLSKPFRESVLVVAPDVDERVTAYQVLDRHGFLVATSEGGLDGLKYAARSRPRVVVLDWNLPDLTGPTMLEAVWNMVPDAVVLVLRRPDERLPRLDVYGKNVEVLDKPLEAGSLLQAVNRALCLMEPATPPYCQDGNGRRAPFHPSCN